MVKVQVAGAEKRSTGNYGSISRSISIERDIPDTAEERKKMQAEVDVALNLWMSQVCSTSSVGSGTTMTRTLPPAPETSAPPILKNPAAGIQPNPFAGRQPDEIVSALEAKIETIGWSQPKPETGSQWVKLDALMNDSELSAWLTQVSASNWTPLGKHVYRLSDPSEQYPDQILRRVPKKENWKK